MYRQLQFGAQGGAGGVFLGDPAPPCAPNCNCRYIMLEELIYRQLQFGAQGGAGGVFLGDPEPDDTGTTGNSDVTTLNDNINTTNTNSTDDSSDDSNQSTDAVTGIAFVLALVAALAIITLGTWLISKIIDRYCCCIPGWRPVDFSITWDHSQLAKKARLFGLTLEERKRILKEYIFAKDVRYGQDSDGGAGTSSNSTKTLPTQVATGEAQESNELSNKKSSNKGSTTVDQAPPDKKNHEPAKGNDEVKDDPLNDADHERLCCICLAEYQPGDRVLRGETCRHQFHWQCCLEWMAKPQDHCPYCRQLLVSVPNFRQGAIQCLGHKRVEDMGAGMVELAPVASTTVSNSTNHNTSAATATVDAAVQTDANQAEERADNLDESVGSATPNAASDTHAV